MLQSKLFCKTKREAPKEAEIISHKLLIRADFIEQSFGGVYRILPLGFKVFKKIKEIIRKEMLSLGAQELYLPALQNKNLWSETNRWQTFDPPLFKLKDRHQKEIALGPTHEEEITDSARRRVKSYQDLPFSLFQIQNKFRNEMRPTGGILRTLEFVMKDLYSFHTNEKDLTVFYEKVKKSYLRIFKKCGLDSICVRASSGTIGGELSHEFMVPVEEGENKILICKKCGLGANIEKIGDVKNCPECKSPLIKKNCIEIGHIFNLGTKYSKPMGLNYLDKNGKLRPIVMCCYGIGLQRLLATIVEVHHDEKGIIWPKEVAPYQIHLIKIENVAEVKKTAEKIYKDLSQNDIEVLYDDRDKSPGEKFADADLIGIPLRIVVSERTLQKNSAEVKERKARGTKLIKIARLPQFLNSKFKNQK